MQVLFGRGVIRVFVRPSVGSGQGDHGVVERRPVLYCGIPAVARANSFSQASGAGAGKPQRLRRNGPTAPGRENGSRHSPLGINLSAWDELVARNRRAGCSLSWVPWPVGGTGRLLQ